MKNFKQEVQKKMTFQEPQSRNEAILQNILGADNELTAPESRIETLLQEILDQNALNTNKFELIETIEIEDSETSEIERTNYDYTKVFIRGRIEAGEGGTIQTIIGGYNCGWWAENTNGGVADTFAQIINGMFFAEYGQTMTQAAGSNTPLARREVSWGQLTDGNIESIKITSSKTFPEGTTFEIYAV